MAMGPLLLVMALAGQAKGTTKADWKAYPSTEGKYAITFPAKPTEKRRVLAIGGETVDLKAASARKGTALYSASYAELKGADPEAALKAGRDDVVAQSRGEVKAENPAELGDSRGIDLAIEVPKKVVPGGAATRSKIFVIGDRIYVLSATAPQAKANSLAEEMDRFFDSFQPEDAPATTRSAVAARPDAKPPASNSPAPGSPLGLGGKPGKRGLGPLAALNPFSGGIVVNLPKSAAPPPATRPPASRPRGNDAEWKVFTTPNGEYSVSLPGVPREMKVNAASPAGPIEILMYVLERPTKASFIVASSPTGNGPINIDASLESSKMGMIRAMSGSRLLSEKDIVFDGHKGKDLTLQIPSPQFPTGGTIKVRVFIANRRVYQMQCLEPNEAEPIGDEDLARYFDSIQIREK